MNHSIIMMSKALLSILLFVACILLTSTDVHVSAQSNTICIGDQLDLDSAIDKFFDSPSLSGNNQQQSTTKFDISTPTLTVSNSKSGSSGINVTNQAVIFDCVIENTVDSKCSINAQSLSRHFILTKANVTFQGMRFVNGLSSTSNANSNIGSSGGGALLIESSTISFIDCVFSNNTALTTMNGNSGGAIFANNSNITFINCLFENNKATNYGAVMNIMNSIVNITNIVTSKNVGSTGTIALWDSKTSFKNWEKSLDVTNYDIITNTWDKGTSVWRSTNFNLLYSSTSRSSQSIIGSMKSMKYIQQQQERSSNSKCSRLTRAPVPVPVRAPVPVPVPFTVQAPLRPPTQAPLRPPTQAPLLKPTRAPIQEIPTRRRGFCFSSHNHVEVQGIGSIVFDQLRIGDYVKAGDGTFTQVYGFGHLDHHYEATFLQIYFHVNISTTDRDDDDNTNNTLLLLSSPLEITPGHLILLDRDNKRYPIRASDVRVGDILSGKIVKHIDTVNRRGLYAPLTQSGDIIVSDIVASNYIDLLDVNYSNNHKYNWYVSLLWNQHVMGHILVTPQRVYCFYNIEHCKKERYINGYGYLLYVIVQVGTMLRDVVDSIGNAILFMSTGIMLYGYRMIVSIVLLCMFFFYKMLRLYES